MARLCLGRQALFTRLTASTLRGLSLISDAFALSDVRFGRRIAPSY